MAIRSYKNIYPIVGARTYIDEQACVMGDVVLGEDCSIWPMAVLRGDVEKIRVGHRTNIQDGTVCHVTHYGQFNTRGYPLLIGDDVTVGHNVTLHACTVGNRCLIGMGSVLLDDVVVEDEVFVGAGALVSPGKILESRYLYLGNPAKKIRLLTEEEIQFLSYSAKHYMEVKDDYLK